MNRSKEESMGADRGDVVEGMDRVVSGWRDRAAGAPEGPARAARRARRTRVASAMMAMTPMMPMMAAACSNSPAGPTMAAVDAGADAGPPPSTTGEGGAPSSIGAGSSASASSASSGSTSTTDATGDGDGDGAPGTSPIDAAVTSPADDVHTPPLPDGDAGMPWRAYNYAPTARTLAPVGALGNGNVGDTDGGVLSGRPTRITGQNSSITFDFGREVGGIVSLKFGAASDGQQSVGLAFSESSQYVGRASDESTGGPDVLDGTLVVAVTPSSTYVMPTSKLRGGFRYLSVYLNTSGWVDLSGVSLNFTPAPAMPAPDQYPNYFYSNDVLLNRIWYAGAYTVQMNTIDPRQGRVWPPPPTNWDNSATVGVGSTVLVDGAKRDRAVWAGDLGVSLPTAYVSTGDLASTKNALDTLYAGQDTATGEFPRSGPPLNPQNAHTTSDTYHLWTLVGAGNYFLYSGDKTWLDRNWAAHKKGIAFSTSKIGANGLMQVTLTKDWGRLAQGGANIAANSVLYRVLSSAAYLASVEGDTAAATTYSNQTASIKAAANSLLWDATAGAFRDNPTSGVYPQDGNALAIWFGLVDTNAKAQTILATLRKRWNAHGAHTPECDPARCEISPFAGSMEVAARFAAGDDVGGLSLIRLEWGYMLDAPTGTASTFWEGYLDDGGFGYTGAYMSAAHGWSSGPTFALTQWALGVAPDTAAGRTYHVIPHPGDLTHVEGSLAMAAGQSVVVSYDHPACGDFTMVVDSSSNAGSVGVIAVPRFGQTRTVQVNGVTAWNGASYMATPGLSGADQDANFIYFRGFSPGRASFAFSPKACP